MYPYGPLLYRHYIYLVAEVLEGALSTVKHYWLIEIRQLPLGLGVDSYQIEILPTHLHKTIQIPLRRASVTT